MHAASSAAAEAEAAAVVNAAFADVIKSPIGSPIASPAASPRGSPNVVAALSRRKQNKGSGGGGGSGIIAPLPTRGGSDDRPERRQADEASIKQSEQGARARAADDRRNAEAGRGGACRFGDESRRMRMQEEEAIAELKQKRKTEAARLRSLEEKARLQEVAMKQMQTVDAHWHADARRLAGVAVARARCDAPCSRRATRSRSCRTGQSMVASLIDESLAQSSPRGSPRASKAVVAARPSSRRRRQSNKSKREAEAAALRAKLDELQLRRGVLMGTITDVERSLGNKKKDVTTLNMLAELTVQLGEIDDRTVAIGNEIAELMQDPEEELRELLRARAGRQEDAARAGAHHGGMRCRRSRRRRQAAQALPARSRGGASQSERRRR
jgi:hypothetical protein